MSFNDYINKLVIDKEDVLLEVVIPTKEDATLSFFQLLLKPFRWIINLFNKYNENAR